MAADWPQFLGPTADGVSTETGLIDSFPKGGLKPLFAKRIGTGYAAPSIRDGKAVEENAPFYIITGGGGGGLEDSAPTRPFFQNNVRHGHHYVMVHINGGTLELKAYTVDNRLFDYVKLKKP